jgi:hypothetical protein
MTSIKFTKLEVLFEHRSYGYDWRGVRAATGGYRVDRRKVGSLTYRPVMWTGNRDFVEAYQVGGAMMTADNYGRRK